MGLDNPIETTKAELGRIEETPFEHFVGEALERGGWETEVTKQSGDGGVDVFASHEGLPDCEPWQVLIQARRYTANKIQPNTVEKCLEKIHRNYTMGDRVLIISTGECTPQGRITARKRNVGVWDGQQLSEYLIANDALDLLDDYT